jgi:hypothetical protein
MIAEVFLIGFLQCLERFRPAGLLAERFLRHGFIALEYLLILAA